jgi:hypothetical protein
MSSRKAYDQATKTDAIEGEVSLDGPDGIGLSMTPDAAEVTAKRLLKSVAAARQQTQGPSDEN